MVKEIHRYKCGKCGKIYRTEIEAERCEDQIPKPCPFEIGMILRTTPLGNEVGYSSPLIVIDHVEIKHEMRPEVFGVERDKSWIKEREQDEDKDSDDLNPYFYIYDPVVEVKRLQDLLKLRDKLLKDHKKV